MVTQLVHIVIPALVGLNTGDTQIISQAVSSDKSQIRSSDHPRQSKMNSVWWLMGLLHPFMVTSTVISVCRGCSGIFCQVQNLPVIMSGPAVGCST